MTLGKTMPQPGHVYVLFNQSANGIVKIGKTQRDPEERAKELSSATGVATPFMVMYQAHFNDCDQAELFVHTKLEKIRVANNREFFQIAIPLAIEAVIEAKHYLQKAPERLAPAEEFSDDNDFLDSLTLEVPQKPGKEIFELAEQHYYGQDDDVIQDYDEAFDLYKKAANLGFVEAYLQLGTMCREGEGCSPDNKLALQYFKQGVKHGDDECWGEMARIYCLQKHTENEKKCWDKYFGSKNFSTFGSATKVVTMFSYVKSAVDRNEPLKYREQILQVKDSVLKFFERLIELNDSWRRYYNILADF